LLRGLIDIRRRCLAWLCGLLCLTAVLSLGPDSVVGQTSSTVPKGTPTAFRTPDGQPDLQGIWNFSTLTPLERPAELADKEFFTPAEAVEYEKQLEARRIARRDADARTNPGVANVQNDFWFERGTKVIKTLRTSLITDPPNGKLPPVTPEAEQRRAIRAEAARQPPGGPEDFTLTDRCLIGFNSGPPMIPGPYNNNVQLLQSRNNVAIYNEMVHDARIIPLDDRPPLGAAIRQYAGDSRGRWEGDTLVVETANFRLEPTTGAGTALTSLMWNGALRFLGSDRDLRLVERFTRADADTLLYEYTVSDPKTWTRPWSAALTMSRRDDKIFEYACHEGNYSLANMLTIVRAAEKAGANAKRKP
jgi:hypothetical protein